MIENPCYINKKGNVIKLQITKHAYLRFKERWELIYQRKCDINIELPKLFNKCNRLQNLSCKDKQRLKKHGKDTLFFRTSNFTFVVQDGTIVTVEISDKNKRYLN